MVSFKLTVDHPFAEAGVTVIDPAQQGVAGFVEVRSIERLIEIHGVPPADHFLQQFICSGVSEQVGVSAADDSYNLVAIADEIKKTRGIRGLISADRVFGQLEMNFSKRDIETSVGKALKPKADVDDGLQIPDDCIAGLRKGMSEEP